MPSLRLESAGDSLDLDYMLHNDYGVQAVTGAVGFGLPPVEHQWLEGAGDGAQHLGMRVAPRDIDLPLYIKGRDRADLKTLVRRLTVMLSGKCTLYFVDDDGYQWGTDVWRVGGGNYVYGVDTTGTKDLELVITLRAGDPYFTSTSVTSRTVLARSTRGLIGSGSLVRLKVSGSSVIGTITLVNDGDAIAFPKWTLTGPGNNFQALSPTGEQLVWTGSLAAGETLTIDCATGTVIDNKGVNRYSELSVRPRFWSVPVGTSIATATMAGIVAGQTRISCEWRARRWVVI